MKCIDEKKMKLLQNIIELKNPIDEEEGLKIHEIKIETVFVKKILDIAKIKR